MRDYRDLLAALIRVKQAEAWSEGYQHGYVIGAQEHTSGIVLEYTAPNPYVRSNRDPLSIAGMDAEIELVAALKALTDSRARYGDLEARVREKQAEAWDEAVQALAWANPYTRPVVAHNPYRTV